MILHKMEFVDPTLRVSGYRTFKQTEASAGSPVQWGRRPKWLRLEDDKCEIKRPGGLDHWGTTQHGDEEVFVYEPYELGPECVDKLQAFCKERGCFFLIVATSAWFPTRTLRVIIFPPEQDTE